MLTKEFLSSNGIQFEGRDLDNDPKAAEELNALGLKATPVTVVGDRAVVGFDVPALKEAFGIRGEVGGDLSAAEMLKKCRVVYEGAKRAILQIPDEQLEWVCPETGWTLRQLSWHLFVRTDACMQAVRSGHYTHEMLVQADNLANNYRTTQEIVEYANGMTARLEDFLINQTHLLEKVVETYFTPRTGGSLLNLLLGQAVFHLKQIYHYLKVLGIEADRPLGEEEFSGISVPKTLF